MTPVRPHTPNLEKIFHFLIHFTEEGGWPLAPITYIGYKATPPKFERAINTYKATKAKSEKNASLAAYKATHTKKESSYRDPLVPEKG